ANERRIDIWYQSGKTGSLMLLLGYLMTRSAFWEQARLRVLVAEQNANPETTKQDLIQELERARISAEAVVVKDCSRTTIIDSSADASLVFLPLTLKKGQIIDCAGELADDLLPNLPLVALIVAAQQIDLEAEPEEGAAGLLAKAEDALAAAQKRLQLADKEVLDLNASIEKTLTELLTARQQGNEEETEILYAELAKLRQQLDKAIRRSAKAETKLEQEKNRLEKLREEYHLTEPSSES
ncbi:MAG: amino acid permease, partial [Deltaproteobacteria bacterium]|nr:amino acid permease [Deltaproteobacteria bacterium]